MSDAEIINNYYNINHFVINIAHKITIINYREKIIILYGTLGGEYMFNARRSPPYVIIYLNLPLVLQITKIS